MYSNEYVKRYKIFMYDKLGHAAYEEAKDFNKRVYDFFQ